MGVVVPALTWATDYRDPELVHLRETCDGEPRTITVESGEIGIAVCRAWVQEGAVSAGGRHRRHDRCVEIANALGGLA